MKFLIVLIISTFSVPVFGQKLNREEIRNQLNKISSISIEYQGKAGVWFSKEDAELLLDLVSNRLKQSFDIIDSQEIQIDALQSAVNAYKISNKSYSELSELNRNMFNVAMEHIPNANTTESSWYESPKATFIYGLIVGGVVIFGTTYLSIKALEQ